MPRIKIKSIVLFAFVIPLLFTNTANIFANAFVSAVVIPPRQGHLQPGVLKSGKFSPLLNNIQPALQGGGPTLDRHQLLVMQDLIKYTAKLTNGRGNNVTGVYVKDVLAYPVTQQPSGSAAYVSSKRDVLTQFSSPKRYGTVGILAHNYLAGVSFYDLSRGQDIYVLYGDGTMAQYVVTDIRSFQALDPHSPYSDFVDLDTDTRHTAKSVFYQVYGNKDKLVLQTCIEMQGNGSWGRMFVIAEQIY
jgi:hypothetical protein